MVKAQGGPTYELLRVARQSAGIADRLMFALAPR